MILTSSPYDPPISLKDFETITKLDNINFLEDDGRLLYMNNIRNEI